MYYPSLDLYLKLYDEGERAFAFHAETASAYDAWKQALRARLRDISGVDRCIPCAPEPAMGENVMIEGMTVEYHTLATEPGVVMPYYLFRPEGSRQNLPVLIIPHGHGGGKYENACAMVDFIRDCLSLGFLVACPDERGSGERREYTEQGEEPEKKRANSHRELLQVGIGFGRTVIGTAVWDLMRLADHLLALPETSGFLACVGMSGGGQQTLWFSALDDRVAAACVSGYFYGWKEALIEQPANCACNYVPFLYETADMGDIGALIAPRPFLIESGEQDHLNGKSLLQNVYPQVEITRGAYRLLGAEENLAHVTHPYGHRFVGTGMKDFLKNALNHG